MEIPRSKQASSSSLSSLLIWVLVSGLLSQNLVLTVMSSSFEDQKCPTCSPDPGSHGGHHHHGAPPSHGGSGGGGGAPPSHGGGGGSYGGTPPSHGGGGGSYGGTPPSHGGGGPPSHGGENCGNPPLDPGTPSAPSHNPTPSTPSHNSPTPSTPSHNNPTPSHPSSPTGGGSPPTPIIVGPPSIIPGTPGFTPTPPFVPNNPFTGTCNYWLTHPSLIWGLLGWWGTIGSLFGLHSVPGFNINPSLSLHQALSNTRPDGLGALFREGTASILNSMVNNRFPYTTQQVRSSFVAALSSDKAASAQARLFKLANEGRLKPRA